MSSGSNEAQESAKTELQELGGTLSAEEAALVLEAARNALADYAYEALREEFEGDPGYILPKRPRREVRSFEPVKLKGRPLSRDVIEDPR